MLDLCYAEDSSAEVDMNVVNDRRGRVRRGAGHGRAVPSAARASTRSWRSPRRASAVSSASSAEPAKRVPSASSASRPRLVLATLNPGKVPELTALLAGVPFEVMALAAFPGATLPEESADSYRDNALLKARAVARAQASGRSATIPGSRSTRSAARPACARRAMAAPASTIGAAARASSRRSPAFRPSSGRRASAAWSRWSILRGAST